MSNVTVLPYESPRCVICGRDLPQGRRKKCYACLPVRTKLPIPQISPEESRKERYTIDDCVALAWAHDISYGRVIEILEHGWPWPPRKRPLIWPEGSAHVGEK